MKASQLVAELQRLIAEEGDLPVMLYDGHCGGWYSPDGPARVGGVNNGREIVLAVIIDG